MASLDKDTRLVMTILFVGTVSGANVYFYSNYGYQLPWSALSHAVLFGLITVGSIMGIKAAFDLVMNDRMELWLLDRKIDVYWQKKQREEQQREKIRQSMNQYNPYQQQQQQQFQQYEEQEVFMAMQSQWQQYDAQLDQLFAEADFKLQDSLIKMYKNDYAGEGTGVTAGRRAAQSAREHGYRVAEETSKLILNMEDVELRRESIGIEGNQKINALFEKVRFPPVPGQTPIPPELEAKPSNASLFLGLASSALMSVGFSKLTAAKNTGMTNISDAAGHAADHGRTLAESTAILNPNQYVETVIDSSGIGQSVVKTWPTLPPRITTSASSGSYWAGL